MDCRPQRRTTLSSRGWEAVTEVSQDHVPDSVYEEVRKRLRNTAVEWIGQIPFATHLTAEKLDEVEQSVKTNCYRDRIDSELSDTLNED